MEPWVEDRIPGRPCGARENGRRQKSPPSRPVPADTVQVITHTKRFVMLQ